MQPLKFRNFEHLPTFGEKGSTCPEGCPRSQATASKALTQE